MVHFFPFVVAIVTVATKLTRQQSECRAKSLWEVGRQNFCDLYIISLDQAEG